MLLPHWASTRLLQASVRQEYAVLVSESRCGTSNSALLLPKVRQAVHWLDIIAARDSASAKRTFQPSPRNRSQVKISLRRKNFLPHENLGTGTRAGFHRPGGGRPRLQYRAIPPAARWYRSCIGLHEADTAELIETVCKPEVNQMLPPAQSSRPLQFSVERTMEATADRCSRQG